MPRLTHGGWLAALAAAAAVLAPAPLAAAAEAIDYQADPGCPDQAAFLSAAARKSAGGAGGLVEPGALKIQLRATPAGYTGRLERRGLGDSATAPRVLSAPRCEEVVEALALTLALSLVPAADPEPVVVAVAPGPAPPQRRPGQLALALGVRAGGFVPGEPGLGPTLSVGLARAGDGRFWTVAFEGGLRLSWNRSDLARSPGRARFELMALGLELCPLHAGAGRARLGVCGLVEAGLLGGQGIEIAHPRWGRAAWLALGGGVDLAIAVSRRWWGMASAQLARPLEETRFVFAEPAETVARTATLVPSGALAVGMRFP
jgi:hypothetical protein